MEGKRWNHNFPKESWQRQRRWVYLPCVWSTAFSTLLWEHGPQGPDPSAATPAAEWKDVKDDASAERRDLPRRRTAATTDLDMSTTYNERISHCSTQTHKHTTQRNAGGRPVPRVWEQRHKRWDPNLASFKTSVLFSLDLNTPKLWGPLYALLRGDL
jgi:hypothetical protein